MKLLLSCFLLFSFSCFAQSVKTHADQADKRGTIKIEKVSCSKVKDNDSIYATVDEMPAFPGGRDSLRAWMNKNLVYPKTATGSGSATVFLSFIVAVDGSIINIDIYKGSDVAFEREALRLFLLMPKWIPGKCNGTVVPVKINYPVKFSRK